MRYGRPPKRKRSAGRRSRVANDDNVCVGLSTVAEDDDVLAEDGLIDALEVDAGGVAVRGLPPLFEAAACSGGFEGPGGGAPATADVLARTHVSRYDDKTSRGTLDAATDRGALTATTATAAAARSGEADGERSAASPGGVPPRCGAARQ